MAKPHLPASVSEDQLRKIRAYIAERAPLVVEDARVAIDSSAVAALLPEALNMPPVGVFDRLLGRRRKKTYSRRELHQLKRALVAEFNAAALPLPFDADELTQESAQPRRSLMMADPDRVNNNYTEQQRMQTFLQWLCVRHALVKAGAHLEDLAHPHQPGGFRETYTRDRYVMINGIAYLPDPDRLQEEKFAYGEEEQYENEIWQAKISLEERGVKTVFVDGAWFEGGNVIRHFASRTIFVGRHGEWSSEESAKKLRDAINRNEEKPWAVVSVPLMNYHPIYHMDLGMSEELPNGEVMLSPMLTDEKTYAKICSIIGHHKILHLTDDETYDFATNFIDVGNTVVLTSSSKSMKSRLARRGYNVVTPDKYGQETFEFGQGGVHCMTNDAPRKPHITRGLKL